MPLHSQRKLSLFRHVYLSSLLAPKTMTDLNLLLPRLILSFLIRDMPHENGGEIRFARAMITFNATHNAHNQFPATPSQHFYLTVLKQKTGASSHKCLTIALLNRLDRDTLLSRLKNLDSTLFPVYHLSPPNHCRTGGCIGEKLVVFGKTLLSKRLRLVRQISMSRQDRLTIRNCVWITHEPALAS